VAINCGAIPETLLESELFGYTKGAFTGATASRKGRIAHAEGGTLFLDEIGELPLSLQVKLLRLLQDRTYEPIGSSQSVAANFRLIVATNRDLKVEVEAGRFRQDLFYRLLVCQVKLPALRERRNDIGPLFKHFWALRGEQRPVTASAMALLDAYDWPGNVRELENFVERLSVCTEGELIGDPEMRANFGTGAELGWIDQTASQPPARLSTPARLSPVIAMGSPDASVPSFPFDLPAYIRDLEDRCITAALSQTMGNKRAAAELLGLQRTTLVEKLRRRTVRQSGLAEVELDPTGS
jgi:sigma-54 specific flagellar transcriptional regulator A